MKRNEQHSIEIRKFLVESVGQGRDISTREAAALAGMTERNLYAVTEGATKDAVAHLPALLNIPPFAERYMAAKSYACTHVGNETGCEYEACQSVMETVGQIGPMMHDGRLCHVEKRKLALTVFLGPVRKMVAYMHRWRRQEAAG
ncbi:hypothetical protein HBA54_04285 [Pelagibius litoralis]|uniref:Uncharacterized protein n=1 Tax=Pelagibius litoralis TaxID=374515 RepID=A0A967C1S0_9PROT|nr:hypothetical protein [Pelagibius litoralis]NIA67801.1 hypothetical protein [Pelagibius litoralis]